MIYFHLNIIFIEIVLFTNVFDIFFIGKKADYIMLNYIQIKLTYIQIK